MVATLRALTGTLLALALACTVGLSTGHAADEPAPGSVERTWFPLRPGDTGEFVRLLQQRLAWLGLDIDGAESAEAVLGPSTMAAVGAFQGKFALRPTADVPKATWDDIARTAPVPGELPRACRARTGTLVCVDMAQRLVRLVRDGRVALTADARFGLASEPTRTGTFRVRERRAFHVSTLNGVPMPYALFYSGGQAIHYSAAFARDGYAGASLGCVNLRDRQAAKRLFDAALPGTPVVIVSGRS